MTTTHLKGNISSKAASTYYFIHLLSLLCLSRVLILAEGVIYWHVTKDKHQI